MRTFVLLLLSLVVSACSLKADLASTVHVEGPPQMSVEEPKILIGNSSTEFVWEVEYTQALKVKLSPGDIEIHGTDSVSDCSVRVTRTGFQAKIIVSGCQGDGNLGISVKEGSAFDSLGAIAPAFQSSTLVTIDNTPPTAALSMLPNYYDGAVGYTYSYFWKIDYQGADEINLGKRDIRVLGNSYGCEPVVSGSGQSRLIMLYGCAGVAGDVSIEVSSARVRDRAGNAITKIEAASPVALDNQYTKIFFKEGNTEILRKPGVQKVSFAIRASAPVNTPVEINYILGPRTDALQGSHTLSSGTITIPAGATEAVIQYDIDAQMVGAGRRVIQLGIHLNSYQMSSYQIGENISQHIIENGDTQIEFRDVVVGGNGHVCGIEKGTDQLFCWGNNQYGKVGHVQELPEYDRPVRVDIGKSYESISLGFNHTCGLLKDSHELRCWGSNGNGVLGDQTTVNRAQPFSPMPGSKFKSVVAGYYNTCVILYDSEEISCWGYNIYDFFGPSISESLTPVTIDPGVAYESVVQKYYNLCGIVKGSGQLKCLGTNFRGQLGDGTTDTRSSFVDIDTGVSYRKIVMGEYGYHTCGLTREKGELRCWGSGANRAFGSGSNDNSLLPQAINAGVRYKDISAGWYHTCVIQESDGEVICFGSGPFPNYGQAGHYRMDEGQEYSVISSGLSVSCGITSETGNVKCWGGASDEVSLGRGIDHSFVEVDGEADAFKSISAKGNYVCGIKVDGSLYCWGEGNLGNGVYSSTRYFPERVDSANTYEMISVGPEHACGIVEGTGVLKCWGSNSSGMLGLPNSVYSAAIPRVIDEGTAYSYISSGKNSTCGIIKNSGVIKCWGSNLNGELGDNTTSSRNQPEPIYGNRSYVSVSVGDSHACAIEKDTQNLFCWGGNIFRQIGNGTAVDALRPVHINSGETYLEVTAGEMHTCGIRADKQAYCWGRNASSQIGDGTTTARSTPTRVNGGHLFSSLILRSNSTCGLLEASGQILCWGDVVGEEYRNLFSINQSSPATITGASTLKSISYGRRFYCGIAKNSDQLVCYGKKLSSQLGRGENKFLSYPYNISVPVE